MGLSAIMNVTQMTLEQSIILNAFQKALSKLADGSSITRTVHFNNDDVPRYLENLRRFEESSRNVVIYGII